MVGIVAGSAVAEADVQVAVRTEGEMAAVVIRERLRDRGRSARAAEAQIEPRRGIGDERIRRAPEPRRPRCRRNDSVKLTKKRPLDASGANASPSRPRSPPASTAVAQVEKVGRQDGAAAHDADPAACSTTNCTLRSSGSWTNATGAVKPDA